MALTVKDVMTRTVVCADENATFKELVRLMHGHRVSALPVIDPAGRAVGVVSEGDLLLKVDLTFQDEVHFFEGRDVRTERRKAVGLGALDLMTTPPITVGQDSTLPEAAHIMHLHLVRRLPVVDAERHVVGIVSRVDLLRAYLREDADLALELADVLSGELGLGANEVRVEAREGVAYLEGTVDLRSRLEEIRRRIRAVDGVVGVDLHLTWETDDTTVPLGPVPWVGF
jgi:CBS domain-containing protein